MSVFSQDVIKANDDDEEKVEYVPIINFIKWNNEMNRIIDKSKAKISGKNSYRQYIDSRLSTETHSGKTIQTESCDNEDQLPMESKNQKKILVVDDSPSFRKFLYQLLELEGHYCEVASNGLLALNMVKATLSTNTDELYLRNYDVIIINLMMPVMNGFDATIAIRELGYTGAILGVTACDPDDQDVTDALLYAGATSVLFKPLQMEELYGILKTI